MLLAGAAHLAACAADDVVGANRGAARYAAAARASQSAAIKPPRALLARQPSPQCERSKPLEGIPPDQARAATLDYERQCYKQLAEIEHARLSALQDAAENAHSLGSAHRAQLERQPPPHCEPTKPPAGLSPAEAREATLDAERQCYKALEASHRQKLGALQDAFRKDVAPTRGQRSRVTRARRAHYMAY
ncbi:MAG TPA: hypothetical protein VGH84_14565 [Steroidobacteraceae bacterium]